MDSRKLKRYIPSWILEFYASQRDKQLRKQKDRKLIQEINEYNSRINGIIDHVASKDRIKVVFYVLNLGMWKSDRLFRLLLDNSRFSPVAVSFLFEKDSLEYNIGRSKEMRSYFESKGFPFEDGFDFTSGKMIDIDSMSPDLVFYPQPYINDKSILPKNALMAYVPYSFMMSDLPELHNFLFQNICWKMFYPTKLHKDMEAKYSFNKGANVVVTGNPLEDYFFSEEGFDDSVWKSHDKSLKRIIWAPHHSIFANDPLDIATFLTIADDMLELTKKYESKVQFAFKPHPRLEPKLHLATKWGERRTSDYYNEWRTRPNCTLIEGGYVDLFSTSDALIHDCGTFCGEYLYVNKPVMFLSDKPRIERFNDFANACYDVHYHGTSITEIERFIQMVIDGKDDMLDKRTDFISNQLKNHSDESVASAIYDEICRGLKVN